MLEMYIVLSPKALGSKSVSELSAGGQHVTDSTGIDRLLYWTLYERTAVHYFRFHSKF